MNVDEFVLPGLFKSNPVVWPQQSTLSDGFKVYPSPTLGEINIRLNEDLDISQILIFNSIGQLMKSIPLEVSPSLNFNVNLAELESGIYHVVCIDYDGKSRTKQIVKR